jgi:hypothetical protein
MTYDYVGNAYKRLNVHRSRLTTTRRQVYLCDVSLTYLGCELVVLISTESSGELLVTEKKKTISWTRTTAP